VAIFTHVICDVTKEGRKLPTSEYKDKGLYPVIDQGQNHIAGYTDETEGLFSNVPAIIFGDHTRIIKYVDTPFFIGADGVKILKAKDKKANHKFLYYALSSAKIPNTGYNRHFKWLKEIDIPEYSEKEQNDIVVQLEKIDDLISVRKQQLYNLDELVKSRFIELFGDTILNPFGWEKNILGSVCDVRDGTHDSPQYYETGHPLVTSKNVTGGKIDLTGCSLICETDFKKINERSKVDIGDIIMPMIGTVGKPVVVDIEPNFAIKNVALIKFKTDSKVLNIYICALLQSDYFDDAVLSKVRGGTQKFISLGDIRKLEVLVPPMEVQNQFATFVEQTDKSKLAVQQSLKKLETLKKSLMQQYFG